MILFNKPIEQWPFETAFKEKTVEKISKTKHKERWELITKERNVRQDLMYFLNMRD